LIVRGHIVYVEIKNQPISDGRQNQPISDGRQNQPISDGRKTSQSAMSGKSSFFGRKSILKIEWPNSEKSFLKKKFSFLTIENVRLRFQE
jgi:hypothetical protein